jgi:hypothetical protein
MTSGASDITAVITVSAAHVRAGGAAAGHQASCISKACGRKVCCCCVNKNFLVAMQTLLSEERDN